jgi:hypothetical protein
MAELDRESDSTRFDTAPLVMIGKEGLTCKDLEECFSSAIVAGQIENETDGFSLTPSVPESPSSKSKSKKKSLPPPVPKAVTVSNEEVVPEKLGEKAPANKPPLAKKKSEKALSKKADGATGSKPKKSGRPALVLKKSEKKLTSVDDNSMSSKVVDFKKPITEEDDEDEEARIERLARSLARKYFWRAISVASLMLGTGCLIMAMNVRVSDPYSRSRRWTKR